MGTLASLAGPAQVATKSALPVVTALLAVTPSSAAIPARPFSRGAMPVLIRASDVVMKAGPRVAALI